MHNKITDAQLQHLEQICEQQQDGELVRRVVSEGTLLQGLSQEQGTRNLAHNQQTTENCILHWTCKHLLMQMELSKSTDGLLHYGQTIMLANKTTGGVLSFNLYEKIINDDAYCVTTGSAAGPCLRNIFTVEHPTDPKNTSAVRFGDTFRLHITNGNSKVIS